MTRFFLMKLLRQVGEGGDSKFGSHHKGDQGIPLKSKALNKNFSFKIS
jgi:hypothetical protein